MPKVHTNDATWRIAGYSRRNTDVYRLYRHTSPTKGVSMKSNLICNDIIIVIDL